MDSCVWYTPLRRLLEGNFLCKTKKKKKKMCLFSNFLNPYQGIKKGCYQLKKKKEMCANNHPLNILQFL